MTASNRFTDEIARLVSEAAGMADGVRREAEGAVKSRMERLLRDMDVVTREEFEAVREMAIRARDENDRLAARLAALEAAQAPKTKAKKAEPLPPAGDSTD